MIMNNANEAAIDVNIVDITTWRLKYLSRIYNATRRGLKNSQFCDII